MGRFFIYINEYLENYMDRVFISNIVNIQTKIVADDIFTFHVI